MILNKVSNYLNGLSKRSKTALFHTLLSGIYKIGTILLSFLLVRFSLELLGKERYGIWLLLASIVAWFTILDVGLGHGLRNHFTLSKTSENSKDTKTLVSSTYALMGIFSALASILFLIVNSLADWPSWLNVNIVYGEDLRILMGLTFLSFSFQLLLKLLTALYLADEKASIINLINLLIQGVTTFFVWILLTFDISSFIIFGVLSSLVPVAVLIVLSVIAFNGIYKSYRPSLRFVNLKKLRSVYKLGFEFFVIQCFAIVLFMTDNLIVSHLFGVSDVSDYQVVSKYMGIVTVGFSVLVGPIWSAAGNSWEEGNLTWISNAIKSLVYVWMGTIVLVLILVFLYPLVFDIWLDNQITPSFYLIASFGLFQIVIGFISIFVNVLNGLGKIRLQLIHSVVVGVLNIPLSYYLASELELGSSGVILATIVCQLIACVWAPIQVYKLLNGRAKGIWIR